MEHTMTQQSHTLIALKKARTLLDRIITMTEEGEYCIDIMQQNLAVIGLLRSAQEKLLENHLHTCFAEGMKTGSQAKRNHMIDEIGSVIKIGNK